MIKNYNQFIQSVRESVSIQDKGEWTYGKWEIEEQGFPDANDTKGSWYIQGLKTGIDYDEWNHALCFRDSDTNRWIVSIGNTFMINVKNASVLIDRGTSFLPNIEKDVLYAFEDLEDAMNFFDECMKKRGIKEVMWFDGNKSIPWK